MVEQSEHARTSMKHHHLDLIHEVQACDNNMWIDLATARAWYQSALHDSIAPLPHCFVQQMQRSTRGSGVTYQSVGSIIVE
jgi:hypothetical protein